MNVTEFNAHINTFKDQIQAMVEEKFYEFKGIDPVVFALVKTDQHKEPVVTVLEGIGPLFATKESKQIAALLIKEAMKAMKPMAVCFACEGWAAKYDKNTDKEEINKMMSGEMEVRESRKKKEILFVTTETHNMENMKTWDIIRNGDDVSLEVWHDTAEWVKKKEQHGSMQNFLKESYMDIVTDVELN